MLKLSKVFAKTIQSNIYHINIYSMQLMHTKFQFIPFFHLVRNILDIPDRTGKYWQLLTDICIISLLD